MKKLKIIIILIIFLGACYFIYNHKTSNLKEKTENVMQHEEETKAIFISYIDYSPYLKGKKKEEQEANITKMINNIKEFGFNTIILQVRPFADAIYPSKYYKTSLTVAYNEDETLDLDILKYYIEESHKNNIKLHAWINPYRVRTTNKIDDISKTSTIYSWLNTNNIGIYEDGIYLNPASLEVLDLILNGVKEIVKNYDVDGIIYDDYFYPNKEIDIENYNNYKNKSDITIEDYRRNNITNLIKKTYLAIKETKSNVSFGISPSGNIENNYNIEYLDIETILKDGTYLDYIMPQIYYGFFNQNKPFKETIKIWNELIINKNVKLYPALSIYKSGQIDEYAGVGSNEWLDYDDIIKKQIIVSKNISNYDGFGIFRYDYLFNKEKQNDNLIKEIENLKEVINITNNSN